MPDEQQQGNDQQDSGNKPDGKYTPSTLEDALKIIGALSKRVEERESEANRYKSERDTLTVAQRKQFEEQGNYKALHEQSAAELATLKPFKERAEALDKIIRASNEERVKTIPDSKKNLVKPLMDVLPPEKLQEYLNANPDLFVKEPAPNYDAGAGGSGGSRGEPKLTAEEQEMAAKMGMKPEDYIKAKAMLPKDK